mmetsp:Transcript_41503/g.72921  ORF Transcript_41503/g.72921 Transcript_41503/m.72921 type:complete len:162 (-) Transcript_41503:40-525(-)
MQLVALLAAMALLGHASAAPRRYTGCEAHNGPLNQYSCFPGYPPDFNDMGVCCSSWSGPDSTEHYECWSGEWSVGECREFEIALCCIDPSTDDVAAELNGKWFGLEQSQTNANPISAYFGPPAFAVSLFILALGGSLVVFALRRRRSANDSSAYMPLTSVE